VGFLLWGLAKPSSTPSSTEKLLGELLAAFRNYDAEDAEGEIARCWISTSSPAQARMGVSKGSSEVACVIVNVTLPASAQDNATAPDFVAGSGFGRSGVVNEDGRPHNSTPPLIPVG
jgi:hypothetical protein